MVNEKQERPDAAPGEHRAAQRHNWATQAAA